MESLLVIFAVLVGAAFADIPMKVDTENDATRAFPLTSSDYLKMVFNRSPDMIDTKAIRPWVVGDLMYALGNNGLFEAASMAWRVDLADILSKYQIDSLTLFAPSNDAIEKWQRAFPLDLFDPADRTNLIMLVKAWIVPNLTLRLRDMNENEMRLPTLANVELRINRYQNGQLTINGATVVNDVDIQSNGNLVHVIDKMIFPLPDGNVIEELNRAGHFTTFIRLIQKGEQDFFADVDGLTVFAPTDRAWERFPAKKMAELQANKKKLVGVLKYHVVQKTYYSAGFKDIQHIKSMEGDNIALSYDNVKDKYWLNRDPAQPDLAVGVVILDVPARNGVIHVIDKVLDLPKNRQA